ncbi:hypothetical protein CASFOL_018627 [Castilleja foliolosa]|uniref:Uncharacterized protein n=1 Tax=Castilleja foliolosa TaxID=1961234 RepID=A0ABD3D865_9LAMI
MSSGLTYSPLRYSLGLPARGLGSHKKQVTFFRNFGISVDLLWPQKNGLASSALRHKQTVPCVKCAMDSTFGDATNDSTAIFPRINVRDPYKRLGISKEASEDEIQSARNFLIQTYSGHKPSVDAIESAHDKIIMQSFYDRKKPKLNIKKKVRDVTQSKYVQAVSNRFRTPSTSVLVKTSVAFVALGVLTVLFPTEEGPTLQVAISLMVTMYFLYERLKSKLRAFLYGEMVRNGNIVRGQAPMEPEMAEAMGRTFFDFLQNFHGNGAGYGSGSRNSLVTEQFRQYRPPNFNGRDGPAAVEEWFCALERIFRVIECEDAYKITCTTYQLVEDAGHWWKGVLRNQSEAEKARFTWDDFKSAVMGNDDGAGSFILSWLVGTFLIVSVMPPILKGPRSLEVTTSLISYIILWVSSTYLR